VTPDYVAAIERAFLTAAARGLMLSARDLHIIRRWSRAGLPAEVVVQAIEEAFDPPPARRVLSLAFVVPAVDRAAQAWQARRVGSRAVPAPTGESDGVGPLIARWEAATGPDDLPIRRDLLDAGLKALRGYSPSLEEDALDAQLMVLKAELSERASAALEPMTRHRIDARLELALRREASFRPPEELVHTAAALRWQALRAHFSLPRLDVGGGW
jgi:hypothetical protein